MSRSIDKFLKLHPTSVVKYAKNNDDLNQLESHALQMLKTIHDKRVGLSGSSDRHLSKSKSGSKVKRHTSSGVDNSTSPSSVGESSNRSPSTKSNSSDGDSTTSTKSDGLTRKNNSSRGHVKSSRSSKTIEPSPTPLDFILDLMKDENTGVPVVEKKDRKVFTGSSAVEWMVKNLRVSNEDALAVGSALFDRDFIHHVDFKHKFKDKKLYYVFSAPNEKRTHILVIGGGYAGSACARKLSKNYRLRVTLLDDKSYWENTITTLRTISIMNIKESVEYIKTVVVPHRDYINSGGFGATFVRGSCLMLTDNSCVTENRTIFFDKCVIATGSRYTSRIKNGLRQPADRVSDLSAMTTALEEADTVLVIGGGLVGCEMAGEIIDAYPTKKVTLVHRPKRLLHRVSEERSEYALEFFKKKNVNVILGETAQKLRSKPGTKKQTFRLKPSGKELTVDMSYLCGGPKPNTQFMRQHLSEALDGKQLIIVDKQFRVKGHSNLFAIGDCCNSPEEKMAERAFAHSKFIVSVFNKAEGKEIEPFKFQEPNGNLISLVLALGQHDGIWEENGKLKAIGEHAAQTKNYIYSFAANTAVGKAAYKRHLADKPKARVSTGLDLQLISGTVLVPNLTTVSRVIAGKLAENGADVYCFGEEGNQTELRDQGVKFVNDLFMKKISAKADYVIVTSDMDPKDGDIIDTMAAWKSVPKRAVWISVLPYMYEDKLSKTSTQTLKVEEKIKKAAGEANVVLIRHAFCADWLFTAPPVGEVQYPDSHVKLLLVSISDISSAVELMLFRKQNLKAYEGKTLHFVGSEPVDVRTAYRALKDVMGTRKPGQPLLKEDAKDYYENLLGDGATLLVDDLFADHLEPMSGKGGDLKAILGKSPQSLFAYLKLHTYHLFTE